MANRTMQRGQVEGGKVRASGETRAVDCLIDMIDRYWVLLLLVLRVSLDVFFIWIALWDGLNRLWLLCLMCLLGIQK